MSEVAANHTPKYLVVRDYLATRIEKGEFKSGDKLPSERELQESFDVARVTIRDALLALQTEGLIYRLDRRGWFVTPKRIIYNPRSTESFMQYVTAQGRVPKSELISAELIEASEWAAERLNIAVGGPVYSIWRKRFVDGRMVFIEHVRVNAALFPDFLDKPLTDSLTEIMYKHYGVELVRVNINLYPASLGAFQARHLLVTPGTLGLYIGRNSYDQFGRVTNVDQEYWVHDALEISLEAHKDESALMSSIFKTNE
ncbi:UTRA domain-containing protein [Aquirhabdus parva]|uniref:UTRA domain-containing protein n=1 Tax=Aquirhabdus parva TaxID=2283318 RepID=A0A345P2J4_9GAMM|nr:UTRA domain-containing protein [Aquirhabdus parva]AXI01503.1 UTRA domain-containing protein [Aquirhabdus parva]